MRTYADARHCPDCGSPLPDTPAGCPACGLPLQGQAAAALFATFQEADRLLAQLRAMPRPATVGAPAAEPAPAASGSPPESPLPEVSGEGAGLPPTGYPTTQAPPPRRGLSGASVPQILLTLGALCLLVAAVTFLAVAWEILGVGGRTAVLVGFTVTAGLLTAWLWRRGLRMAAEALSVVTAGLLTLDLVGASDAGWVGVHDGGLVLLVGTVLAGAGLAATAATRDARPLLAPQVVAALGAAVAPVGAMDLTDHISLVMLLAVGALAGLALLAATARLGVLAWLFGPVAAIWWVGLALTGLGRLAEHPDAADLWSGAHPWPMLAAAAMLGGAVAFLHARGLVVALGAALGAGVATGMVALALVAPALDNSATQAALATLAVGTTLAAASFALPVPWRPAALLPMLFALAVPAVVAVTLAAALLQTVAGAGPGWSRTVGVRLVPDASLPAHPLLLPLTVLALTVGVAALAQLRVHLVGAVRAAGWRLVALAATPLLLSAVLTLAAYDVPLALVTTALAVVGAALAAVFLRERGGLGAAGQLVAAGTLLVALVASLPSAVLTLVSLLVLLVAGGAAALEGGREEARLAGLGSVPPVAAGLVATIGELAGVDQAWWATPTLLVLGALAIWVPRPAVEVPAALAGLVASAASVGAAFGHSESRGLWVLALDLTVAGALVTASSLAHPHRRVLAAPGGLLLAMATWVRLYDLGVTAPEAYTLPSALVLTGLGLHHLRHHPETPTLRALGAGLTLATVPSLLWTLDEPESLRALLLGLACLGLVLAGVRLRWTAPLVIGAVVGAVLVLRELGPHAADLPPWLVIAVAGAALTGVGVTWESRMNDVRRAGRYLAALR